MHEFFEHTADLGLRICAADLDTVFAEAATALFSTIVEDLSTVQPLQRVTVHMAGDDRELLLFDWLKELLYRFDAEHLLFSRFEAHVAANEVVGSAWGQPLDRQRPPLAHKF